MQFEKGPERGLYGVRGWPAGDRPTFLLLSPFPANVRPAIARCTANVPRYSCSIRHGAGRFLKAGRASVLRLSIAVRTTAAVRLAWVNLRMR